MYVNVWTAVTLQNTSMTSKPISIPHNCSHFSLQWTITSEGTPNVDFQWEESLDGKTFILNDSAYIVEDQAVDSGPGGDGIDMVDFAPQPCEAIRIIATEDADAAAVITAVLVAT